MSEHTPGERRGGFSPSQVASKMFGISDETKNAEWTSQYNDYQDRQKKRQVSGEMSTIDLANQMAPNAVKFSREHGRELNESEFGRETDILPGHMSRDPETVAQHGLSREDRELPETFKPLKEPVPKEPTFAEQLQARLTSTIKRSSSKDGPTLN